MKSKKKKEKVQSEAKRVKEELTNFYYEARCFSSAMKKAKGKVLSS
jgi:hypothetical protein